MNEQQFFGQEEMINSFGDGSGFVDETVPDGTIIPAGSDFIKTWTIQNIGNCIWQGRYLQCMDNLGVPKHPLSEDNHFNALVPKQDKIPIPDTEPGQSVMLSMEFAAPKIAGRYISYWKMMDEGGFLCFEEGVGLSVHIQVKTFNLAR